MSRMTFSKLVYNSYKLLNTYKIQLIINTLVLKNVAANAYKVYLNAVRVAFITGVVSVTLLKL